MKRKNIFKNIEKHSIQDYTEKFLKKINAKQRKIEMRNNMLKFEMSRNQQKLEKLKQKE